MDRSSIIESVNGFRSVALMDVTVKYGPWAIGVESALFALGQWCLRDRVRIVAFLLSCTLGVVVTTMTTLAFHSQIYHSICAPPELSVPR